MRASNKLAAVTFSLLLCGCNFLDPIISYDCQMKGEIFRYRNGVKQSIDGEQSIQLNIGIHEWRTHVEVTNNPLVSELTNSKIVLNKKNTTSVERYYQFEDIDLKTNQKIVSNIVINTLSGDARMFHRRWIMPSEWINSDQFTLVGNCRKIL